MNQESTNNIDELLAKKLLNEASPDELREVDTWLKMNPGNQQYYNHFQLIWEQSKKLEAKSTVDTNEAWQRFQARVAAAETPVRKTIALNSKSWMRIAASLVFLIAVGGMVFYLMGDRAMQTIASGDTIRMETLPDNSVVTLNKNSSITFPKHFNGSSREVTMEGEAFFNITPDKNKPFIIDANGIDVKVVGTSFNVKSSADKTEVIVETGIVEVKKQAAFVTLNPHEQAIVRKEDNQPTKLTSSDQLYSYYRTREFECNNTPLYRLVDVLKEAYDTDIVIVDNKLRNEPVTSRYSSKDSLESILKLLSESHNLTIEKNDHQYLLKPR